MSDHDPQPDIDLGDAVMLAGIAVSSTTHSDVRQASVDGAAIVARMAATAVRRKCNQHACERPLTGSCSHPDHRRDADYMSFCLDVLGLPQTYTPVTDDDRANLLDTMAHMPVEPDPIED